MTSYPAARQRAEAVEDHFRWDEKVRIRLVRLLLTRRMYRFFFAIIRAVEERDAR